MTRNETKRWLNRAFRKNLMVKQLEDKLHEAEARATKTTTELTGMPGSPSKDPHKFEAAAILAAQITEILEEEDKIAAEVLNAIKLLDDERERAVLMARYLNFKPWPQISSELGYAPVTDSDGVFRLHRKALDSLGKILEGNKIA